MIKKSCPIILNFFICLWFSLAQGGCAGPQTPYRNAPIDFQYQMQGNTYTLSQLRERPLLLVLVRTAEVTNEMHLDQIQQMYTKTIRHMNILVLSIAPNEAPMLDMFVEFNNYPFHIGLAPWEVASGNSDLGVIPNIPTSYLIDQNGQIIDMLQGATNADKIMETLRRHRFIP